MPEWYPWPETPSLGSWAVEHARLVADGHEVVVLAAAPGRVRRWEWTQCHERGLRTVRLRYRDPGVPYSAFPFRLAGSLSVLNHLRRSGFIPEVIHAHVFQAGLVALALGGRAGVPVVVSEHWSRLRRGQLPPLPRLLARTVYRRADMVCPVSDDLGTFIRSLGVRSPVRRVPNAVDTARFHPPAAPLEEEPPRLLHVGGLVEVKAQATLFDAFARFVAEHAGAQLDVVGDGPLRQPLGARARALGLEGQITFHGALGADQVAQRMRSAHLFVLSSEFESAPHVLLEAMASGLPSVATDVGGISEIVDEESGVLAPPGSAPDLAAAIATAWKRRKTFVAERLARRARERFGRVKVAQEWSEVYEEVIAAVRASSRTSSAGPG